MRMLAIFVAMLTCVAHCLTDSLSVMSNDPLYFTLILTASDNSDWYPTCLHFLRQLQFHWVQFLVVFSSISHRLALAYRRIPSLALLLCRTDLYELCCLCAECSIKAVMRCHCTGRYIREEAKNFVVV